MLVELIPFIPEGTWGGFQDAAVVLGLGPGYRKAISNAYLPLVLPLLRNEDGVMVMHKDVTDEIAAREIVAAHDNGLPGADVWPQDRRWSVDEVRDAYERCAFKLLHSRKLCGCEDRSQRFIAQGDDMI